MKRKIIPMTQPVVEQNIKLGVGIDETLKMLKELEAERQKKKQQILNAEMKAIFGKYRRG